MDRISPEPPPTAGGRVPVGRGLAGGARCTVKNVPGAPTEGSNDGLVLQGHDIRRPGGQSRWGRADGAEPMGQSWVQRTLLSKVIFALG